MSNEGFVSFVAWVNTLSPKRQEKWKDVVYHVASERKSKHIQEIVELVNELIDHLGSSTFASQSSRDLQGSGKGKVLERLQVLGLNFVHKDGKWNRE